MLERRIRDAGVVASGGMVMNEALLEEKYDRLRAILRELGSVAVAFSAGVDSTLVLKVAIDVLGSDHVVAVTGRSESLAAGEFEQARQLAESLGVEHVVIDTEEFENENYLSNPTNRCYFCKTTLYTQLSNFAHERGIAAIVNGINLDDLGDYRPGIEAAREHGVGAPAAEAGLTKEEIRQLSKRLGLPTFDKPASPCLSSRIQYGERITSEKLRAVEAAESYLKALGFGECRVRHHDKIARIEVPAADLSAIASPEMAAKLDEKLRSLGYQYVTLDLRGFRSGSLNEVIAFGVRQSQWQV